MKWILIGEQLPKIWERTGESDVVLVAYPKLSADQVVGYTVTTACYDKYGWMPVDPDARINNDVSPTHWMPLPQPPPITPLGNSRMSRPRAILQPDLPKWGTDA